MKTYQVKIEGVSDLCFGKHVSEPKKSEETHEQYEQRTWEQKVNRTKDGNCFIQPFALKNALESAARWLSMGIPGEGKKTFTKRFASGLLIADKLPLFGANGKALTIADVEPVTLFVPSDGKRGSGRRVSRIFPMVHEWLTTAEIIVLDDKLSQAVIEKHLEACGQFIGLGSMRVENGGVNGRFAVTDCVEVKKQAA